jgi:hypothetical protein
MRNRILASACSLAVLAALASAQDPAKASASKKWQTPWGDPDLQGSWTNATNTPLQRPDKYAGRATLTAEERAALDKDTEVATDKRPARGTVEDVEGAYNGLWWDRGRSDGRTSLIYDQPDGLIPPRTPEAQKRLAEAALVDKTAENYAGHGTYEGPEVLDPYTRCIIRAALPRVPTGYDNNYQIVQSPGTVAIFQEQIHETRVIPLDGRPHLDQSVSQWLGDSRGHWEGNTLVVETTNFSDQASFEGSTPKMRLVERWTRVGDDRIDYKFTVNDPETWTKPWSAAIAWNKTGQLYEYACHEDNYGLYGILSGARARERGAAAKSAK